MQQAQLAAFLCEMTSAQTMLERLQGHDDPISRAIRDEASERLEQARNWLRPIVCELHDLAAEDGELVFPHNGHLSVDAEAPPQAAPSLATT
jgi:hypothetical protein